MVRRRFALLLIALAAQACARDAGEDPRTKTKGAGRTRTPNADRHNDNPTQAYTSGERFQFDIPAQPLATAALDFARQAGVELLAPSALFGRAISTPVRGEYSAGDALKIMLECTGVEGRIDRRVIQLRASSDNACALTSEEQARHGGRAEPA